MLYNPTTKEALNDASLILDEVCQTLTSEFKQYSAFYHIATEAVSTYIPAMGNSFATALTVGGSGDQGIELTKNGAKEVYFFDLNKADIYWLALKKVALETLDRKDFLHFIIDEDNGNIMDYSIYIKIRLKLAPAIRVFWDNIYQTFRYTHESIALSLFRNTKYHSKNSRIINDYYESNEIYYSTQKKVRHSNWLFIESSLYDLDKNLPPQINFDAIILSNIYEYLNFGKTVNREKAIIYLEFIKSTLLPRLNSGGACMCAYLYRFNELTNEFIKNELINDPKGWIPSSDLIAALNNPTKVNTGYTSPNVAYHYLYETMKQELEIQKVKTKNAGYGSGPSSTDLALIHKK